MHPKKILGIVIFLGGLALAAFSFYLSARLDAGKFKLTNEQEKVDSTYVPRRPLRGKIVEENKQQAGEKIGEAVDKVGSLEEMNGWFLAGGIIFVILGTGVFFFSKQH